MGLGINAANDPSVRRYELAHLTGIELVPAGVDEKTLSTFKAEFGLWVTECGLRELIERFALFLDAIHQACVSLAISRDRMQKEEGHKQQRTFPFKGIDEKLRLLKSRFDVGPSHPDYLSSIHQARNCLTHRSGRVGKEDCRGQSDFTIRWQSFDVLALEPGKESPTPLPIPFPETPMEFKQGARIQVRIAERKLTIKKGEFIRLSPKQLAEICHCVTIATGEVCKALAEYARTLGALETA